MVSVRQPVPSFVQLAAHPLRWQLLTTLSGSDYRVREMVTLIGEPQNLISYHLRLLRDGGLVKATRSSFDGRDSYYHLNLSLCAQMLAGTGAALHPALDLIPTTAPLDPTTHLAVLFVCTGNSARSAIAEALLRRHTDGLVETISAGTRPKSHMHPNAVRVLREEFGIDISDQDPRHLDTLADLRFDTVITLCDRAREVCPEFGDDTRWIHWSIPDPASAGDTDADTYPAFQATATEIDTRIRYLLPTLTAEP
ncbi:MULTISPECIES: ArsR family transcriptional regulator [unclassified Rhodococcus (in: high G+C Gram-positive bacteria)]|uniref:arsenate reductase/protein-tyrosine-phosphatase family protein n=1 Tax=unclassified Rhodococcus (in: high G+C Gram-positive bacteria) TaxID=192944 RepID=UPI00163A9FE8|nr:MULTISPECIES: ArsR family transcriptional regulator [unclassified Rhodococcus (in: high G+C Gram-positive bacteria)]MBC2642085.1 ArsR family transcriptional regulator [Rhodococcus sp. 3A]MBC2893173.1 ArsR family transcriptional regulator [Rhodococcus sp. 4CII]